LIWLSELVELFEFRFVPPVVRDTAESAIKASRLI
jgi:hypothetical protein